MCNLKEHFRENQIFDEFNHLEFWRDRHDDNSFSEGAQKAPKTWAYNGYICFCQWCIGFGSNRRTKKFTRAPQVWVFIKTDH